MIASQASFFPRITIPCSDTNRDSGDDSTVDGNFRLLMQRIIRPNNNSKHFFLSGSLLARSYKYAADLLVMTSNDDDHDIDSTKYDSNNGIKTKNKRNQHDDAESVIGRTIEYRTQAAAALSTAVVSALKTPSPFTTPSPTVLCLPSKMKHTPVTTYGLEDTEDEDNSTTIPAKVPNKKRRRQRQQQRQHKRVMRRLFVDELYPGASSSSNKLSNQQSRHHDDYIDLSSIRVDLFK